MELFGPKVKSFLIFSQKKFFLYFKKRSYISYISRKKFLVFVFKSAQEKFFIFSLKEF